MLKTNQSKIIKSLAILGFCVLTLNPIETSYQADTVLSNVSYGPIITNTDSNRATLESNQKTNQGDSKQSNSPGSTLKVKKVEPIKISDKNFHCLAKNIYYEAGVENWEGKIAVAQVTYTRRQLGRWGTSMCDVIYAKSQFSWTKDKKKAWVTPSGDLWEASKQAAQDFIDGYRLKGLDADHYHADYIRTPDWARRMQRKAKIGRHIFYAGITTEERKL